MHHLISFVVPPGFFDPELSVWFPFDQAHSSPFGPAQRYTFRRTELSEKQIDHIRWLSRSDQGNCWPSGGHPSHSGRALSHSSCGVAALG